MAFSMAFRFKRGARLVIPEVVQTSGMDCGPAALKCLLEGLRIPASYGRLREACQTSVDGTSIDTIEEIARQLGLAAEQIMLPADHVMLSEAKALPAIVVTVHPNGLTHFVVAWNQFGPWVQIMDPSKGRRWLTANSFLRELYVHKMAVPAAAWRDWAESEEFLSVVGRRLRLLGVSDKEARALIQTALEDPSWRSLATVDSAVRMIHSVASAGPIRKGKEAARLLQALVAGEGGGPSGTIPDRYWSVRLAADAGDEDESGEKSGDESPHSEQEQLLMTGAVLVRAQRGRRARAAGARTSSAAGRTGAAQDGNSGAGLPRELKAALEERTVSPLREFFRIIRKDGILAPLFLLSSLCLAGLAVVVQALLLDGFLSLAGQLGPAAYRLAAVFMIVTFLAVALALDLLIAGGALESGRRLELRLRVAFLSKIPRLPDAYFRSRPASDMADRCHSVHGLRDTPDLGARLSRNLFELIFTTAGIIWLDHSVAFIASITALISVLFPLCATRMMTELDLRVRSHAGAMAHFYLDALLGLVPIRAHGAERSVRREHEALLTEWAASGYRLHRVGAVIDSAQCLIAYALVALLVFKHLQGAGGGGGMILLVYWALNIPVLGDLIVLAVHQYPGQRNTIMRLTEPLGAPEQAVESACEPESESDEGRMERIEQPGAFGQPAGADREGPAGVAITMRDVRVIAAGHAILDEVNLDVSPGEHVAIVGHSGAGKSSLAGILLGWHRVESGRVLVDGEPLSEARLTGLRRRTAWVDPAVQLWNRSLLDNVSYGSNSGVAGFAQTLDLADLRNLLERLPDGLQTKLGEGGALVSGGEGQRVRFARAIRRDGVELVILDEPFRGLDRVQRRLLLERSRELWGHATLLCITHDLAETQAFERVVVIESGRIVEDGSPVTLARVDSRYRAMLDAEEAVRDRFRSWAGWRRLRVEGSHLTEEALDEVAT
jgi:ABC-type bacteriocin/lantibiotic exporter with double-glycine peptidase domain